MSTILCNAPKLIPQVLWCEDASTLYFVNSPKEYAAGSEHKGNAVTAVYGITDVIGDDYGHDFPAWHVHNENVETVVFDELFKSVTPESGAFWFEYCYNLTSIEGLQYLNTSEMISMSGMFHACESLQSVDVSHFNTSKVTDMSEMFSGCNLLMELDLSSFDTRNVISMESMFSSDSSLERLNVSTFNTANVRNMDYMFSDLNSIKSLDLTSFDTSNVESMSEVFVGFNLNCFVYISDKWTVENVKSEGYVFDIGPMGGAGSHVLLGNSMGINFAKPDTPEAGRFLTNRIYLPNKDSIYFPDTVNNLLIAGYNSGKVPVPVQLYERTLFKDGGWNTLCLPFSLTAEQIANSPMAGVTLYELTSSKVEDNKFNLYYTVAKEMRAGVPYMAKWEKTDDAKNPEFNGVEFTVKEPVPTAQYQKNGYVNFVGVFSPVTLAGNDKRNRYLSGEGKLVYPANDYTMNSFRCYWQFSDSLVESGAPTVVLNFVD